MGVVDTDFATKRDACLTLRTESLCYNVFESLEGLYATNLELASVIHKVFAHFDYLPLSVVGAQISMKNFLRLAWYYPGLPPVIDLNRNSLERYLMDVCKAEWDPRL